jgi:predicted ribonuclease YlaK
MRSTAFEDNHLVIPLVVLEELDGLKKGEGETGANAREAIRNLERLRCQGDLLKGSAPGQRRQSTCGGQLCGRCTAGTPSGG